jgi:hypothetical protein
MLIFIIFLTFCAPAMVAVAVVFVLNRRHEKFINPLTKSLRRPPGAQLGRLLGAHQIELGFVLVEMILPAILPIVAYARVLSRPESGSADALFIIALIGWAILVAYVAKKLVKTIKLIRTLRLGYECELAVGQELDLLMLKGFRIFHDVPAEHFNIDHIVVGPPGVFAVETKGRSKIVSNDGEGKKQFRATYKDGVLHFPNGPDRASVPQAIRQAKWVFQWLGQATGQRVPVQPVVVLPGWFVENKDRSEVPVIASGYIQGYFLGQKRRVLDDQQISQIVYQIDQKVRDLAPGEVVRPLPVN